MANSSRPEIIVKLLLLGCGGVGRCLIHHIVATRSLHAAQGLHIAVLGVCDSRAIVRRKGSQATELDNEDLHHICSTKASGHPLESLVLDSLDIQAFASSEAGLEASFVDKWLGSFKGLVIADCTASNQTSKFIGECVEKGSCIVLANKKPLTLTLEVYDKITSTQRRLRCESTVGAGLPVIVALSRILCSGDVIVQIVGALSGTLGYVMSELQTGNLLSVVVKSAKELGYTEPDPRDDLSGMDVARKALIMARQLGWRMDLRDVQVESLYSSDMGPEFMSVDDFLEKGLTTLDENMKRRVEVAASKGCVLRYVATIQDHRCKVGLLDLPCDSPLGRLRGSDNLIEIYSRCYASSPLIIQGAGAGNDTTAAGVLADIVDLQEFSD
ncbi:hypothetical protein O6H91_23G010000 [Diphasiastrum complanatum]|uniref:Uncharacterized protein n=1 Tax=Diphasiastrum complanatum TaxID=34168 RepID=A0ACC2A7Z6_DIPCM|nr:hypothetical protein O6H91_23G010000 [Diphasiastrum complanatum]